MFRIKQNLIIYVRGISVYTICINFKDIELIFASKMPHDASCKIPIIVLTEDDNLWLPMHSVNVSFPSYIAEWKRYTGRRVCTSLTEPKWVTGAVESDTKRLYVTA